MMQFRARDENPHITLELKRRQCRECTPTTNKVQRPAGHADTTNESTEYWRTWLANRNTNVGRSQRVSDKSFKYSLGIATHMTWTLWSNQRNNTSNGTASKDDSRSIQHYTKPDPAHMNSENHVTHKTLGTDVVEPAQSTWTAPTVFTPKKDGTLLFWMNYRKLNAIILWNVYLIPRMDQCIDCFEDFMTFWTLHAYRVYWEVDVANKDRNKNRFFVSPRTIPFCLIAIKLNRAPTTFQRAMHIDSILS